MRIKHHFLVLILFSFLFPGPLAEPVVAIGIVSVKSKVCYVSDAGCNIFNDQAMAEPPFSIHSPNQPNIPSRVVLAGAAASLSLTKKQQEWKNLSGLRNNLSLLTDDDRKLLPPRFQLGIRHIEQGTDTVSQLAGKLGYSLLHTYHELLRLHYFLIAVFERRQYGRAIHWKALNRAEKDILRKLALGHETNLMMVSADQARHYLDSIRIKSALNVNEQADVIQGCFDLISLVHEAAARGEQTVLMDDDKPEFAMLTGILEVFRDWRHARSNIVISSLANGLQIAEIGKRARVDMYQIIGFLEAMLNLNTKIKIFKNDYHLNPRLAAMLIRIYKPMEFVELTKEKFGTTPKVGRWGKRYSEKSV